VSQGELIAQVKLRILSGRRQESIGWMMVTGGTTTASKLKALKAL